MEELAEEIKSQSDLVYKLNGFNIAVRNSSNKKIATVWNPNGGRANALSLYINYSPGTDRPSFGHEIQDFNPPKDESFKVQINDSSATEEVIRIMAWANSTY